MQIGMLEVVSVLMPYSTSNIKTFEWWIKNGGHLAEILGENMKTVKSQF